MIARDVIGKRIVAVRQQRYQASAGDWRHGDVTEIELEDGTLLRPLAVEIESADGYAVVMIVVKPRRKARRS